MDGATFSGHAGCGLAANAGRSSTARAGRTALALEFGRDRNALYLDPESRND
jgi:hypothetical protein